jgi:hypothetical protein
VRGESEEVTFHSFFIATSQEIFPPFHCHCYQWVVLKEEVFEEKGLEDGECDESKEQVEKRECQDLEGEPLDELGGERRQLDEEPVLP